MYLGMQHSGPQFIHYVIPSAFLLRFEMCQNKNLEKNKKPWSLGGGHCKQQWHFQGDQFNLSWLFVL